MGNKRLRSVPKSQESRLIINGLISFSFGTSEIFAIPQKIPRNVQSKFNNLSNGSHNHSAFEFLLHVPFAFPKKIILIKYILNQ